MLSTVWQKDSHVCSNAPRLVTLRLHIGTKPADAMYYSILFLKYWPYQITGVNLGNFAHFASPAQSETVYKCPIGAALVCDVEVGAVRGEDGLRLGEDAAVEHGVVGVAALLPAGPTDLHRLVSSHCYHLIQADINTAPTGGVSLSTEQAVEMIKLLTLDVCVCSLVMEQGRVLLSRQDYLCRRRHRV